MGVLENEKGRTRREGGQKFGNPERTYFLNVPFVNASTTHANQSIFKHEIQEK